ncbi:hypothetical protein NUACC21_08780 [Scytonema sp. NUACC21]
MRSIKIRSHVGADGMLHLNIPLGLTDRDVEIMVIYQPLETESKTKTPQELGWAPGFFENTFGAWEGEPLVREPQGEPQERNWDDLFA